VTDTFEHPLYKGACGHLRNVGKLSVVNMLSVILTDASSLPCQIDPRRFGMTK